MLTSSKLAIQSIIFTHLYNLQEVDRIKVTQTLMALFLLLSQALVSLRRDDVLNVEMQITSKVNAGI